jgi:hypothetical protein
LVRGIELDMLEPTVAKNLLKVFEIAVPSEESTPLIDISVIDEWVELRLACIKQTAGNRIWQLNLLSH